MRFSWQNYRRYAMGKNELRPLTKDGFEGSMFGELTQWRPQCFCPFLGSSKLFWTQRTQVLLSALISSLLSDAAWESEAGEGGEHGRLGKSTLQEGG